MNKIEKLYFAALKSAAKENPSKDKSQRWSKKYEASKKFERAVSTGRKLWDKGAYDDDILKGMARVVFADQWAVRQEEKGRSFSGQDIYDVAPKTPPAAKKWAKLQAAQILRVRPKLPSLTKLFELAQKAGYKRDAESFGAGLGLQIVGHGVSVTDNMPAEQARIFGAFLEKALPRSEFYL